MKPFFQLAFIFTSTAFLILPMSSKSLFCNIVHSPATDLYFNPLSPITHQSHMQSLISISFRMIHPITQSVRMRFIYFGNCHIYVKAFIQFFLYSFRFKNDSYSQNIINLFKRNMLGLHFIPYGIWGFYTCLDFIFKPHLIQFSTNRRSKLLKNFITGSLGGSQFILYLLVLLRMFISETKIFQLGFNFI